MNKVSTPNLRFKEFDKVYNHYSLKDILELLTDFEANGSFASVKNNVTVKEEKDYAWYVRATDLENNTNTDNVKYVDEHSYKFLKKTPLYGNELLITKRGEIGKVYFFNPKVSIKATVAPNMYLLKLNDLVNPKYVYYSFINDVGNKKLKRINASTTIGALYKDDVKSIKLIYPPLQEQQKIASFLTAIDTKITQLIIKKALLEYYKKGVMQQLFSQEIRFKDDNGSDYPEWEEKRIGDIAEFYKGKGISKNDVIEDGVNECIRYGELYTLYKESIKIVSSKTNEELNKSFLSKSNDVIIPASGETEIDIAKASCVLKDGVMLGGDLNIIRSKMNGVFLTYYLNGKKKYDIAKLAQGSSVIHLYSKQLSKLNISIPKLEEQNKIADFLSAIDEKIEAVNAQIEKTTTFKKGLLQQMFI